MDQQRREKLKQIFEQVILNQPAGDAWIANVDPDFLIALNKLFQIYEHNHTKYDCFRAGVIFGGIYETWKKKGDKIENEMP